MSSLPSTASLVEKGLVASPVLLSLSFASTSMVGGP